VVRGSGIRLVGVFAHPDDDVYSIGGSLALERDALDVTLVFCTSGDAGPIWIDGVERGELGPVREREQAASMAALGIDADVRFLRHPDYHLPEVPFHGLVAQIEAVLREVRPHLVVTFGPDGWSGHHDHARAGEATDAAFERARADGDVAARCCTSARRGPSRIASTRSCVPPGARTVRRAACWRSEAFRKRTSRSRWTRVP